MKILASIPRLSAKSRQEHTNRNGNPDLGIDALAKSPPKFLMRKRCFTHLKNNSTCQRHLQGWAMVRVDRRELPDVRSAYQMLRDAGSETLISSVIALEGNLLTLVQVLSQRHDHRSAFVGRSWRYCWTAIP